MTAPFPAPAPAAREAAPLPAAFRKMKVEQTVRVPSSHLLAARLLALPAVALLVLALLTAPDLLLLPFPWQDGQRLALASGQRSSLYLGIDRAAKTFFLLEGRFPENLSRLRQVGLLAPGDLRDPQGSPLRYSAREESYTVRSAAEVPGAESTEAITGNFLLDPEFLSISHGSEVPLVLLD